MKILFASKIHQEAIDKLKQNHDVVCAFGADDKLLKEVIADREAIVFRSGVQITAEVMACAPDLKLILRGGSGFDNIDLDYVNKKGIPFYRIPGPGAKSVSELAFTLMLALSRNLFAADRLWRQGHWVKSSMTGYLLTGKTLGIIGVGNIGSRTGKLGAAWDMTVIGHDVDQSSERKSALAALGIQLLPTVAEVLAKSDYICIHVPLMPATRNLIGAAELAQMKPSAYLISLARGGVVNEAALLAALEAGQLAGAGLDVHEHEGEGNISPFAGRENVILTPHIGSATFDSQKEIGEIVIKYVEEVAST